MMKGIPAEQVKIYALAASAASRGVSMTVTIDSVKNSINGVKITARSKKDDAMVPTAFAAPLGFASPIHLPSKTVPPVEIPSMMPVMVCIT